MLRVAILKEKSEMEEIANFKNHGMLAQRHAFWLISSRSKVLFPLFCEQSKQNLWLGCLAPFFID